MDEIERLNGIYGIGTAIGVLVVLAALFFSAQPVLSVYQNETVTTASVSVNEWISVTLSGVPITFPSQNPGALDQAANVGNGYPMNITINIETNANTNISLNGSDFGGAGTFGVGNLSFSNVSNSATATDMSTSFSSGSPTPYSNWVDIPAPGGVSAYLAESYFWIDIPAGQTTGAYSSNVTVKVETA